MKDSLDRRFLNKRTSIVPDGGTINYESAKDKTCTTNNILSSRCSSKRGSLLAEVESVTMEDE